MKIAITTLALLLKIALALPAANNCSQRNGSTSEWWNYFARMTWPTWSPYSYGGQPWQHYNQYLYPQQYNQQWNPQHSWNPYGYGWSSQMYGNGYPYSPYGSYASYLPIFNSVPVYLHNDAAHNNNAFLLSPDARAVDPTFYNQYMLMGRRFCIAPTPTQLTSVPVYAYRVDKGGGKWDHFYTTNINEIGTTTVGAKGKYGYICLGILGYVSNKSAPGLVPVYRYNSDRHYYSLDSDLAVRLGQGLKSEGVMGYTVQCPPY